MKQPTNELAGPGKRLPVQPLSGPFLCRTVLACCQCKLRIGYEGRELMKERDGVGEKERKRGKKEIEDDCCPVNLSALKSVTGISCLGTHE